MKLLIAATQSELITALYLKSQYYQFAEFDLLIVGKNFPDAQDIIQRANQSGLFRKAAHFNSNKLPSAIAFAYYDEVIMEVYPFRDELIPLFKSLQSVNKFVEYVGFTSSIRGDRVLRSHFGKAMTHMFSKLFVFNKQHIPQGIRVYDISATFGRDLRDLCNYILGYQPINSTSLQAVGYPASYTPACFKPKSILLDMTTVSSQILMSSMYQICQMCNHHSVMILNPDTMKHPIWGGDISVYRQQYPLELLAINGALDELLVVIPQAGCLSNLHLLQHQNVKAVIVGNEKSFPTSEWAEELREIYGRNPYISIASIADLGGILQNA